MKQCYEYKKEILMKKIILYIIFVYTLNIICLPLFAEENTLTVEQKKEINALGNKIVYLATQKNTAKACFLASEMINKYPKDPNAYFSFAFANFHAGNSEKAIEYYKKCIEFDKKYHEAYFNIGLVKYSQKKYKEAIKYYTKAIKITTKNCKYKKENALAYSNRALAKYFNNNLKGALKDYNKSLSIMPYYKGVDHVYFNRGLCKYDLGDKSGADEDFNTAIKLNPDFKYIYYDKKG